MVDGEARKRLDRVWRAFAHDEAAEFDEPRYMPDAGPGLKPIQEP